MARDRFHLSDILPVPLTLEGAKLRQLFCPCCFLAKFESLTNFERRVDLSCMLRARLPS